MSITGRGIPKSGAMVCMDLQVWTWPKVPHADEVEWLESEPFLEGYQLRGPHFGGDPYGNGALYVPNADDIVWEPWKVLTDSE